MRKQMVECSTVEEAYEYCPWACCHVDVVSGFVMFESVTDYEIYINQL